MLKARYWLIIIGFIISLPSFVAALENEAILTKKLSIIEHDQILLGDIFDHLPPEKQGIVITHAPLPGGQTVYHASYLANLAQMHELNWQPKSPFDQTIVRRQAQILPHEILQHAILEKIDLGDKATKDQKGKLEIEFLPNPTIYYTSENPEDLRVQNVQYDPGTHIFQTVVMTDSTTLQPMTYRVTGRLVRTVQVPILTRAVERQGTITKDDIEWIEMTADRVSCDVITDIKETENAVAKHKLKAEQVLRKKDIKHACNNNRRYYR